MYVHMFTYVVHIYIFNKTYSGIDIPGIKVEIKIHSCEMLTR